MRSDFGLRLSALAVAVALSACGGEKPAEPSPDPVTLGVAGRSNDNVSIAAKGEFVAVAWSASTADTTDLFVSTSVDGGQSYSVPARVNSVPGNARVGGEQPPRVVLVEGEHGTQGVAVVWTARSPAGTQLLTARSFDGGQTFRASTVVPGGEGAGNRGWESVAVDSAGRVFVLWLDHRESVPGAMHHQEHAATPATAAKPKVDPVEKAGKSQLFVSTLDGKSASSIARGVCYCCKTSLAASGGSVFAVWRHVFEGNQRDIGFSMSADGGKSFSEIVRVSDDHWQFDGCPENGPAIAIDGERRAHVLWPTPVDGKEGSPLALYHAVSRDGRTFSPRTLVPTEGPANHVQVALEPGGSLVITWDEVVNGARRVSLARGTVDAAGAATFTTLPSPAEGDGLYPAIAATAKGTVLAWVRRGGSGNMIGVARVPAAR